MKVIVTFIATVLPASLLSADPLRCGLAGYKAGDGLTATVAQETLAVAWSGEAGNELRLRLAIERAQPIVRDLHVRRPGGQWTRLGQNLVLEFHVTSGVRRVSHQQLAPLRDLGVPITPEVMDREKWYVFWDAPLYVPGVEPGATNPTNPGLPRSPDEIREATSTFATSTCAVKTDGARLEVTFPGLSMGIFAGSLRVTVDRGTSLIRLEAVAKTDEPSVAYKYRGGSPDWPLP